LAVDDLARQKTFDGALQNAFADPVADLKVIGNRYSEFDKRVIEKGHAALNRAGHAHLVLLHEQLDQVGFLIRVEHARERCQGGPLVPVAQKRIVGSADKGRRGEEPQLFGPGESAVEVVEIEFFDGVAAAEKRVLKLAAHGAGEQVCMGDAAAHEPAESFGEQSVDLSPTAVDPVKVVPRVAAEQFVAAFAGEDYFDVARSKFGNEVQRNTRRPGDRLVLVPDEAGQGIEEIFHADDGFFVLSADAVGHVAGIGELAESGLAIADSKGFDGAIGQALHDGGNGARINAAAQE